MQTVARARGTSSSSEGGDAGRAAVARGALSPAAAAGEPARWRDDDGGAGDDGAAPFVPLTREQAQVLRQRRPSLSPWRVIALQAVVGAVGAVLAALVWGSAVGVSFAYGAAAVVVPGALLARGLASPLSRTSPAASAVSFMCWEMVKIAVSVAMLALAPRIVPELVWPALLAGLVLGMKTAWLALLWQPRPQPVAPTAAPSAAR